ncbi:leucine-rich repeat domain-containing protein [Aureispira anguillae]|uniref:Disease resistance R13L4/SHOC-2-like LRR domain-containing protein n=1 Tax=Aureispira anguillae TaxID=2864201 RepID=A0A915YGC3_9BACT|nr:hypothetical protein [Aureispira anguillae]BDS12481.1 hypothetical protein AsAng_0032040 [Aureispira anguillae]
MKQYYYDKAPQKQKYKVQNLYIESRMFEQAGQLPAALFEYTNVEILGIRGYLETIPPEIVQLKQLKKLTIAFLGSNGLPEAIGGLEQLEELVIMVTAKPIVIPQSLSKLKHLKAITLKDCKLDAIPVVLSKIPSLVELNLAENRIAATTLANKCFWPNLEKLNLDRNNLTTIPDWVYEHGQLKQLFFSNNKLQNFDQRLCKLEYLQNLRVDANRITALPSEILNLQQLIFFNWFDNPIGWIHPLVFKLNERLLDFKHFWRHKSKQSAKTILSIRKAVAKANLIDNAEIIEAIVALLNNQKEAIKNLTNASILACYAVRHNKLREAIITEITKRLGVFDPTAFVEGCELLILGSTIKKKSDLKKTLKLLNIAVVSKKTTKTSHVLLGKNIKNTAALTDNQLVIVTETELNHFLDAAAPAYLLEEEIGTEHIQNMLLTLRDEDVLVALELLKSGGVPKELMTTLFFVHKFSSTTKIVRQTKNLLTLNASNKLLEKLKSRIHFRQFELGYFKAWHYIDYINDICAETALNKMEFLRHCAVYHDTYRYNTMYLMNVVLLPEEEQRTLALDFWKRRINNNEIELQGGESGILTHLFKMDAVNVLIGVDYSTTILGNQDGISQMKRLHRVVLNYYTTKKIQLPKDFGALENLETLELKNILFDANGWESLKQLKSLKNVSYKLNGDKLPPQIFELTQIEILTLEGKKMQLDFPIEQLKNLRELHLLQSELTGAEVLFQKLEKMPNLSVINLHTELEKKYKVIT